MSQIKNLSAVTLYLFIMGHLSVYMYLCVCVCVCVCVCACTLEMSERICMQALLVALLCGLVL